MSYRNKLYNDTIDDIKFISNSIINNNALNYEYFNDLDKSIKFIVLNLILKSFKEIFRETIQLGLPVTLPTIGKLKIKNINKLALKYKSEIAKDLGYINYSDIPKLELDKAKIILDAKMNTKNVKSYLTQIKLKNNNDILIKKKVLKCINKSILKFNINKLHK